ncbi:MAG: hypothetical protein KME64_30770 [Scytonematopsis contorta HA4267-MV1]|jgi:hypothetical protein|nr:hypothetical protein [Scytonematopsis contorta HA4267-MV1]
MLRGGSWINNPENCRSAYRNDNNIDNNIGFRVVVVAGASALHILRASGWEFAGGIVEESRPVPVMLMIVSENKTKADIAW